MNIVEKFLDLLGCWYGDHAGTISRLNTDLAKNLQELAEAENALFYTRLETDKALKHSEDLEAQNQVLRNGIIPQEILVLADTQKNRYPARKITYSGYKIKLKDRIESPEIVLQDFIQVLKSHKDWCKLHGFSLKEYAMRYSDLDFGEIINKLQFDIFKKYVARKKYLTDLELYGVDEQWSSVLDSWYLKLMDCENSAHEILALFKAAGLDGPLESFSWEACGMTHSDYGHATIYCYDFKDGFYRHLESTLTRCRKSNFHELPAGSNVNDRANLKSVWFSFNSEVARHTFKTEADAEAYEERDRFKDIIIGEAAT